MRTRSTPRRDPRVSFRPRTQPGPGRPDAARRAASALLVRRGSSAPRHVDGAAELARLTVDSWPRCGPGVNVLHGWPARRRSSWSRRAARGGHLYSARALAIRLPSRPYQGLPPRIRHRHCRTRRRSPIPPATAIGAIEWRFFTVISRRKAPRKCGPAIVATGRASAVTAAAPVARWPTPESGCPGCSTSTNGCSSTPSGPALFSGATGRVAVPGGDFAWPDGLGPLARIYDPAAGRYGAQALRSVTGRTARPVDRNVPIVHSTTTA